MLPVVFLATGVVTQKIKAPSTREGALKICFPVTQLLNHSLRGLNATHSILRYALAYKRILLGNTSLEGAVEFLDDALLSRRASDASGNDSGQSQLEAFAN